MGISLGGGRENDSPGLQGRTCEDVVAKIDIGGISSG